MSMTDTHRERGYYNETTHENDDRHTHGNKEQMKGGGGRTCSGGHVGTG